MYCGLARLTHKINHHTTLTSCWSGFHLSLWSSLIWQTIVFTYWCYFLQSPVLLSHWIASPKCTFKVIHIVNFLTMLNNIFIMPSHSNSSLSGCRIGASVNAVFYKTLRKLLHYHPVLSVVVFEKSNINLILVCMHGLLFSLAGL